MSTINLLPWRAALEQRRQKEFFLTLLGVSGITLLLMFGGRWALMQQVSSQQSRNQSLQNEITLLNQQLTDLAKIKEQRRALLERMGLITKLQERRNLPVKLFNQLPKLTPNGIYLSSLTLDSTQIGTVGRAEAYGRVATFMRQIDHSGWLGPASLSTIFAAQNQPIPLSEFTLRFAYTSGE